MARMWSHKIDSRGVSRWTWPCKHSPLPSLFRASCESIGSKHFGGRQPQSTNGDVLLSWIPHRSLLQPFACSSANIRCVFVLVRCCSIGAALAFECLGRSIDCCCNG